jgi:uncharacterized phage infection (PIP) family protein YhgE
MFSSASTNLNLFPGAHLSTLYLILAIALTGVSLYIAIKKSRQDSKSQFSDAITDKVLSESKAEIADTVKAEVITAVREEIANIDYKITRNGKNTDNLGDVAARTEEKVDLLTKTVEVLATTVTTTNDKITEHIGWHRGFNDSKKKES